MTGTSSRARGFFSILKLFLGIVIAKFRYSWARTGSQSTWRMSGSGGDHSHVSRGPVLVLAIFSNSQKEFPNFQKWKLRELWRVFIPCLLDVLVPRGKRYDSYGWAHKMQLRHTEILCFPCLKLKYLKSSQSKKSSPQIVFMLGSVHFPKFWIRTETNTSIFIVRCIVMKFNTV